MSVSSLSVTNVYTKGTSSRVKPRNEVWASGVKDRKAKIKFMELDLMIPCRLLLIGWFGNVQTTMIDEMLLGRVLRVLWARLYAMGDRQKGPLQAEIRSPALPTRKISCLGQFFWARQCGCLRHGSDRFRLLQPVGGPGPAGRRGAPS